jgi:hypothetical protein
MLSHAVREPHWYAKARKPEQTKRRGAEAARVIGDPFRVVASRRSP